MGIIKLLLLFCPRFLIICKINQNTDEKHHFIHKSVGKCDMQMQNSILISFDHLTVIKDYVFFIKIQNCHLLLMHIGCDSNRHEIGDVEAHFYCSVNANISQTFKSSIVVSGADLLCSAVIFSIIVILTQSCFETHQDIDLRSQHAHYWHMHCQPSVIFISFFCKL